LRTATCQPNPTNALAAVSLGLSFDVLQGKTYKLTLSASCGLTSCQDINVSKVFTLDTGALKQFNPAIGFTKRF